MPFANPEQIASIASFVTYAWIEPVIWHTYGVPHLLSEDLPSLCDYDEVRNLIKRSYPVRRRIPQRVKHF